MARTYSDNQYSTRLTRESPNTRLRPRHSLRQVYPHPILPPLKRRREQAKHTKPERCSLRRITI